MFEFFFTFRITFQQQFALPFAHSLVEHKLSLNQVENGVLKIPRFFFLGISKNIADFLEKF